MKFREECPLVMLHRLRSRDELSSFLMHSFPSERMTIAIPLRKRQPLFVKFQLKPRESGDRSKKIHCLIDERFRKFARIRFSFRS
jgi:hypothetical protein